MKGKFKGKAKTWLLGETKSGGEEIAVEFEVLTEGAPESRVYWRGYFTEASWERTVESLRYMGWKGDDLAVLEGLDTNEVELDVIEELYEGKTYTKVNWVNKLGGLAVKAPLTEDRKKAFAAGMRDKIRALDAAKGERKPAARPPQSAQNAASLRAPEPPPITEKDLPF